MRGLLISANGLFFLFFLMYQLNAQDNFIQGYVINKDSDSISGFIHFSDWDKNPNVIRFKSDFNSDEVKYNPNDILAFSVAGDIYQSAVVEVETSPWDLQDISKDATFSFRTDTVFLRILVFGEKSLYSYKPNIGKDQFYLGNDSGYELLLYKEYIKVVDGYHNKVKNNKYIGQLIFYLQDCPKISEIVSNAAYTEKDLLNVFMKYNSCLGQDLIVQDEKKKTTLNWGVLAGISITSVILKGDEYSILTEMNFPKSNNFTFGGILDVVFTGNQGKWSLNNELMWSSYITSASYTDIRSPDVYDIYDVNITLGYLKLNNMMRFRYPIKKLSIFANLGISNGIAIINSSSAIKYYHFYSSVDSAPISALEDFRTYEFGYIMGGGLGYKSINLEFRYEIGSGFSTITSLKSKVNRMFFTVFYTF